MNSLDKKSIDSFLRVTGGLSKASSENNTATTAADEVTSRIESALNEGENIRLILRSNGHEFPTKESSETDDSNYIVCLAHHAPSDQFILFAFNSITMPCRLIRYDRDGNVIENNNLFWDAIDAAVLVAAVNKCLEGNSAYFNRAGCTSDVKKRGECLRLVNTNIEAERGDEEDRDSAEEDEDEDEYEAIRSIILTELLNNGQEGGDFHHPDPSFLLPLSESISQELKRWRYLCNHIPPRSEWPELPSPSAANMKGMSMSEKEELEEPWLRSATMKPQWTTDNLESQISFGWGGTEHEVPSVMNFVIDSAGLMASLEGCVTSITTYTTHYSQTKFDSIWTKKIQRTVNYTLDGIKALIASGDLRNASILSLCCLRVFCDGNTIGAVRYWFENNESYDSEYDDDAIDEVLISKFEELWGMYHPYVAAIALACFDVESPNREAGAHWFLDALQSGLVYAPSNPSDFRWITEDRRSTKYEGIWHRLAHPASGIFYSHGWQHPMFYGLRCCSKGDELSLSGLSEYEAPFVIKERFNMMKELGRTREAIVFARILRGDHECIQYLFNSGLVDEAMVQASTSKNVEGLYQLSKGLVSTNPCASVLCIQAYIISIIGQVEDLDVWNKHDELHAKGIDKVVDILQKKWNGPSEVEELTDQQGSSPPSLRLLATSSLARAFLGAAKSTVELQAIFERKCFAECGISPLLATIPIITRATLARTDASKLHLSLERSLWKIGLLFGDKMHLSILDSLGQFECAVKTVDGMDYLDLVCFLYESAKFLIEEGCRSVFCFTLALLSSVQIAVRTGCKSFALDLIGSLGEIEEDRFAFERYSSSEKSPLRSLSKCFSALFIRYGYDECQDIQKALIETFLRVKVKGSDSFYRSKILFDDDMNECRLWMGQAYSHYHGGKAAIDLIASTITSNNEHFDIDVLVLKTLRSLRVVHVTRDGDHTMKAYVKSTKREHITEKQRDDMIIYFISQVLETSSFLAADTIAELIQQSRAIDPLFLVCDPANIETNLSASESRLGLSKKASLFITSTIMHYVHDNNYTVLELGLSWLRTALCSRDGVVQFDNYEEGYFKWASNKFEEERDYSVFFEANAWSSSPYYTNEAKRLRGKPKFAAKALIAVLEAKALILLEETPRISHLCQETLVLCRVLDFLLAPTVGRIAAVDEAWCNEQLRQYQLPQFLQPSNLVSIIMDLEWSVRPDYPAELDTDDTESSRNFLSISFLDERAAIAAEYGRIAEAASLCATAFNKEFWAKLSHRTDRWSIDFKDGKKIRRVLRACLHIMNGAISSRKELADDFVNQALHMILSMNWFRACTKCSPETLSKMYPDQLVVCVDSIALVHEIASAWCDLLDKNKSPFGLSMSHCLSVIQTLSQCLHMLNVGRCLDKECDTCYYRRDVFHTCDDDTDEETATTDRQTKSRKKRKLIKISTNSSDLKELERYAAQLHMKEQCEWCKDAIRRLEAKNTKNGQK